MLACFEQGRVRTRSPALLANMMEGVPVVSSNTPPPIMVFPQQQSGWSVAVCIWALPLQGWPLFWMNGWKETWMSLESLEHSWDWGWRKCSVDLDEKCWIWMKRDRMTVYNIFWIVVVGFCDIFTLLSFSCQIHRDGSHLFLLGTAQTQFNL